MTPSVEDAKQLLETLNAPARLLRHVELVAEAGEQLLICLTSLDVSVEVEHVRVGILVHDIGKIAHPDELDQKGSDHEAEGERLLLSKGWPPSAARICRLHAAWGNPQCTLEDLLVALADKLWKGKRVLGLEELVLNRIATTHEIERWHLFTTLDSCFEEIANGGDSRLARSQLESADER